MNICVDWYRVVPKQPHPLSSWCNCPVLRSDWLGPACIKSFPLQEDEPVHATHDDPESASIGPFCCRYSLSSVQVNRRVPAAAAAAYASSQFLFTPVFMWISAETGFVFVVGV